MKALALVLLALAACGGGGDAAPGAAATGSASTVPSAAASAPPDDPVVPDGPAPWEGVDIEPPPPGLADPRSAVGAVPRRVERAADEPVIGTNRALFERHYEGPVPYPLDVRTVELLGDRRALLFTSRAPEVTPLVLVVDAAGNALWHKRRPLAGTHERWRALTLAGGPGGSVLIFWWDVTSQAIAGRRWQFDGSVFADFHFFDVESCSGLDAFHWPGHGWVVTAVSGTRATSELLREDGFRGFGDHAIDVGGTHDVLAPVVAAGAIDGVFFAYVGRERGASPTAPAGAAHLWVTFRRADGSRAWKAPVDLGPVPPAEDGTWSAPRIELVTPAEARITHGAVTRTIAVDGRLASPR